MVLPAADAAERNALRAPVHEESHRAPCGANADCLPADNALAGLFGGSCIAADAGWPGGYCSAALCTADQQCPGNGYCVPTQDGTFCYANCNAEPCRTGYLCSTRNYGNVDGGVTTTRICLPN